MQKGLKEEGAAASLSQLFRLDLWRFICDPPSITGKLVCGASSLIMFRRVSLKSETTRGTAQFE